MPALRAVVLLLLLCWKAAAAQTAFHADSVNLHFQHLINTYRKTNGKEPLRIHPGLKEFADAHAAWLAEKGQVAHSDIALGVSEKDWLTAVQNRIPFPIRYLGENVGMITLFEKLPPGTRIIRKENQPEEISNNSNEMAEKGPTNLNLARAAFLLWKYSPPHNALMLSPEIHAFYLAYNRKNKECYFELVAVGVK